MKIFAYASLVLSFALSSIAGEKSIYEIPTKTLEGEAAGLGAHRGKVVLVVNVASRCGYTPQYKGLEALYQKFKEQGLVVCGFPCNQFGRQEPGTASEIRELCSTTYSVTFPMYEKIEVKGANRHPIYGVLSGKDSPFPGDVRWNFSKFLVGKDGSVLRRFESSTKPLSSELVAAVELALK
ncbi:glutathione peroxidase [bacterium]|nr:glutathione peroxidase [bacterium]MDB4745561.1 glutathione peroxidase [Verrucomicrobiota bacterium]